LALYRKFGAPPIFSVMKNQTKRTERRVKSKGYFELFAEEGVPISAELNDISLSGLCLETSTPVALETKLRLSSNGFTADGVVRSCERDGELCRLGVALIPPDAS
jgi:hypothetical protein